MEPSWGPERDLHMCSPRWWPHRLGPESSSPMMWPHCLGTKSLEAERLEPETLGLKGAGLCCAPPWVDGGLAPWEPGVDFFLLEVGGDCISAVQVLLLCLVFPHLLQLIWMHVFFNLCWDAGGASSGSLLVAFLGLPGSFAKGGGFGYFSHISTPFIGCMTCS